MQKTPAMKISEIARRLGLPEPGHEAEINTLLTDSRSLENPADSLFFAIPTEGNDGHNYIGALYRAGVRNFVVNRIPEELSDTSGINWLIVPDTVRALQATASRSPEFQGQILAITGSRGKTTLKEWIFQLMEPIEDISRSPRSYNSRIGVPLSMWEIRPGASLAIIEAGISRPGEMDDLQRCILPDTVIVTNVGSPHAEGFSSVDEKADEKLKLAREARLLIYSADDKTVASAVERLKPSCRTLSWSTGGKSADITATVVSTSRDRMEIHWKYGTMEGSFTAPFSTEADLQNGMHALAFMLSLGLEAEVVAERFNSLHKIGTRLNVSEGVNGSTVVLDQYTSDFSSLRPALDFVRRRQTPDQQLTLVLSDLHHGDLAPAELYEAVASLCRRAGVTRFIGVGPLLKANAHCFEPGSLFFNSVTELISSLSPSDFSNEIILLKGSPELPLGSLAEILETRRHETVLEVNLDSIISNFNYFRSAVPAGVGIVCMVKAFGYGAGSYEIAKTLQDCGAAYLAVAVLDEGIDLRRRGITMPIMVMNPKVANYKTMFAAHLEPEIYSFQMLRDVVKEAGKNGITAYPIHLKLDTGMHRMGFIREELPALMDIINKSPEIELRSVFSHLATADCADMDDYTQLQLERFSRDTDYILARYSRPVMRHILNSAGILRFPQYHYDMVRLGIGLYGANTLPPEMEKPLAVVSTLRTHIIAIREYEAGESVGYGRRTILSRPSRIATIPIGYADGMNRHFGRGNVSVLVNGQWAPTAGNICMDACMLDVTGVECAVGDSVEIFGPKASLQRLADTLDTIPYEILTSVSPRVKRVYYRE